MNDDDLTNKPERQNVNARSCPTLRTPEQALPREPGPPTLPGVQAEQTERQKLLARYSAHLQQNPEITRALVSFQANKSRPFYRWFKYREGFSSELVRCFLDAYHPQKRRRGRVLDAFAGIGTTVTTAAEAGWKAVGIELLPIGEAVVRARLEAETVSIEHFKDAVAQVKAWW